MTNLIAPFLIGASTAAADVGMRVIEQQPVGLGSAVSIAVFVGGACFWLSGQFARRDLMLLKQRDEMITLHSENKERLIRIEVKIGSLPCKGNAGGQKCAQ